MYRYAITFENGPYVELDIERDDVQLALITARLDLKEYTKPIVDYRRISK